MIGKPRFKYGDVVEFMYNNEKIVGTVEIIDSYGTYFDKSNVSYDIMCDNYKGKPMFFKHVREDGVKKHESD